MKLNNYIIDKLINYLARKLSENHYFQKVSLTTYRQLESMRQAAFDEFPNNDYSQTTVRQILRKLIDSGRNFIKKP